MKRVFTNADQVIHLWANQSQSDARCGNVFFEGNKIYSYGYHYLLGEIVTIKGNRVVLINNKGYSVTTNKHINAIFNATRHLNQVSCNGLMEIKAGLLSMQDSLINYLMGILNQSKPRLILYNTINDFNNLTTKLGYPELTIDTDSELVKIVHEHIKFRQIRQKELNSSEVLLKKQAKQLAKTQKDVQTWRSGGPLVNSVRNIEPQLLRVVNEQVQTSRGATVPLTEALKLLRLVESKKVKSGEQVGSFTFNRFDQNIAVIGCHKISIDEAKNVLNTFQPKLKLVGS